MKLYIWRCDGSFLYYRLNNKVWEVCSCHKDGWVKSCNPPSWIKANVTLIGNNYRQK